MTLLERVAARPVLLSALTALVVAAPSLGNAFAFDDVWIIVDRDLIHQLRVGELLSASYWPAVGDHTPMWRPIALLGFALQWAAAGGSPVVFHVVSAGLYAVVAGLVAWLCSRMLTPLVGAVAGLLFAVHPVHVEVTANVVGQAELLAAAAYLAALALAWRRAREERASRRTLLGLGVVAAVLLGLGAKEHVVTVPAALVVIWWVAAGRRVDLLAWRLRREGWLLLAVVVVIGGYLWMRSQVTGNMTDAGDVATGLDPQSAVQRAVVMLPVSLTWLRVLFFPIRLSADYSPQHLVAMPSFGIPHVLALAIWTAAAWGAWRARQLVPAVVVGLLLFVVTTSVVSNVFVPLEVLFAERLLFLPSVGWALVVAGLVVGAMTVPQFHRPAVVIGGVAVIVLGARSMVRAPVWRNNDVLFARMLEEAPLSFRGHWAAGAHAFAAGDSVAGERAMREAVRLNPHHPQLLDDLGRIYAASGRYSPAIPLLDRAVELDSTRVGAALALALSLSRTGLHERADTVLRATRTANGESQALLAVQTEVLRRAGRFAAALDAARRAVARDPDNWRLRMMAAETAAMGLACEVALAQVDTALQRAPEAGLDEVRGLRDRLANRNGPCK